MKSIFVFALRSGLSFGHLGIVSRVRTSADHHRLWLFILGFCLWYMLYISQLCSDSCLPYRRRIRISSVSTRVCGDALLGFFQHNPLFSMFFFLSFSLRERITTEKNIRRSPFFFSWSSRASASNDVREREKKTTSLLGRNAVAK